LIDVHLLFILERWKQHFIHLVVSSISELSILASNNIRNGDNFVKRRYFLETAIISLIPTSSDNFTQADVLGMSQNGFIFPNFRGEHKKIFELPPPRNVRNYNWELRWPRVFRGQFQPHGFAISELGYEKFSSTMIPTYNPTTETNSFTRNKNRWLEIFI